jgi:hypothetical protein
MIKIYELIMYKEKKSLLIIRSVQNIYTGKMQCTYVSKKKKKQALYTIRNVLGRVESGV